MSSEMQVGFDKHVCAHAHGCRLFELRTKERDLISEISGSQGQNKNLSSRIAALDEQVVKQQELLYNVEFQLQQMERKVRALRLASMCVQARMAAPAAACSHTWAGSPACGCS